MLLVLTIPMNLTDLTLLTTTFNDTLLTGMMLKSFAKQLGQLPKVIIIDNGNKIQLDPRLKEAFTVIDNFRHKILSDENQPSRNHCKALDYALNTAIHTKWVLLVDNDILFKPTVKELLLSFDESADCIGEIGWDIIRPERLFPYFCLINMDKYKRDDIHYFNPHKCMKLFDEKGNELHNVPHGHSGLYDTGYSFLESIKQKNWAIHEIQLKDYIVHLKNGSFGSKNICEFLTKYKNLH